MKYLFSLVLLSLVSFSGIAQSKDEKAVAAVVEQLRKAMIDADKVALDNLAADNLSYGHSSGHVEGKKEFVENIVSGKSDFVTIDLTDQTISVTDNIAVVRHNLNATTNDGGKPGTAKIHVLSVWEKTKAGWKMIARQAVKLPVS
jgi:ketosteroid isomerase-like protein